MRRRSAGAATTRAVARSGGVPRDAGFTLVELLIASMLLLVVIAITGGLLIRTLTTQNEVRQLTTASNEGQVTIALIERSLRNAATVDIPSPYNGDLLVVKTRNADPYQSDSWTCRAWYYHAPSQRLFSLTSPATGTPATLIATPPSDLAVWKPVLDEVVRTREGAGEAPVFQWAGPHGGATVTFDALGGSDDRRVSMASSVIPRPQGAEIGATECY